MSTKRKAAPAKLAQPVVKAPASLPSKMTINESSTAVSAPQTNVTPHIETIEISSDSDSSGYGSDEEEGSAAEEDGMQESEVSDPTNSTKLLGTDKAKLIALPNGALPLSPSSAPADAEADGDALDSDAEPTFGDLLRGQETIDVPAHLPQIDAEGSSLAQRPSQTQLQPPPASSLGTVLSQALRTDDTDLLESCLDTTNLTTIRNTIERLDSRLAGILLDKLATRLHRRPGRAGSLITWVQWTLVAHGGALTSQPDMVQKLASLQKVLAERARGLNPLLVLKGKLDMLDSQMQLRRAAQRRRAGRDAIQDAEDQSDEEGLVWAEGDDELDDDADMASGNSPKRKARDVDDDEDGILPATNGIIGDSDEEDDEEGSDDESEASVALGDEDDVNHEDVDDESMGEDEDSDGDAAPPAKVQKTTTFSKRK